MSKPRVAILTTFAGSDEAYSVANVCRTHVEMLLAADHDPAVLVASTWRTNDSFWDGRKFRVVPTAHPDAEAGDIEAALLPILSDFDVVLCHDILFLGQHARWAVAMRSLSVVLPKLAWVHFQHSRGDGQKGEDAPPRSWWGYPNMGDLDHVAQFNRVDRSKVRFVPHPLDFRYLGWPALAVRIAEETNLPEADVACVLPTRLDRGKQVDKWVRLAAGLKRAGRRVCFLLADAYATGDRFLREKEDLRRLANELELTLDEVVFLGERYDECRVMTPRQVVKALLEMSNLFVLPSNAETYSLVAAEAALAGNLLVLNEDFAPIHHLYQGALTLPFGSVLVNDRKYWRNVKTTLGETQVEDAQLFWDDQAKQVIVPALNAQLAQRVKRQVLRERWPSHVWADHFEPLMLAAWEDAR